jgi:hypothetical protein
MSQADKPIFTEEGEEAAPKLEPKTVMVPPSRGLGEENEMMVGESYLNLRCEAFAGNKVRKHRLWGWAIVVECQWMILIWEEK